MGYFVRRRRLGPAVLIRLGLLLGLMLVTAVLRDHQQHGKSQTLHCVHWYKARRMYISIEQCRSLEDYSENHDYPDVRIYTVKPDYSDGQDLQSKTLIIRNIRIYTVKP